jgi:hypothetical protein
LLEHFLRGFEAMDGNHFELFYLRRVKEMKAFKAAFAGAESVLLAFPLYTDAMPGLVKGFIEELEPFCGREGNPAIGFLVQSGFPEAIHSRYVERYLEKLSARLGCQYVGTIVKGGAEGIQSRPDDELQKLFDGFRQVGKVFGETGQFDETLLRELAKPERIPRILGPVFQVLMRTKYGTMYWDGMLKKNGAYEDRFAQPYAK